MDNHLDQAPSGRKSNRAEPSIDFKFLVGELRCAALRARLHAAEIDSIGVALKANIIDADTALSWAADVGALGYIGGEVAHG